MVEKFIKLEVDQEAREARRAIDLCRAFIIASEVPGSEKELDFLNSFASMIGIMAQAEFIAKHLEPHEIGDRQRFATLATKADNMAHKLANKFSFIRKQIAAAPAELQEREQPKRPVRHVGSDHAPKQAADNGEVYVTSAGHKLSAEARQRQIEAIRNSRLLNPDQVREIRELIAQKGGRCTAEDWREIGAAYNVDWQVIYRIARGESYKDVK